MYFKKSLNYVVVSVSIKEIRRFITSAGADSSVWKQ